MDDKKPQRAKKGSIAGRLPIRLSEEMQEAIQKASAKDGISAAEWVRGAIQEKLQRRLRK